MKSIEVAILNPYSVYAAEQAMLFGARLTQRGEKLETIEDVGLLYNKTVNPELVAELCELPHPTLQKFGTINIVVCGLSRRALGQITRHQNEVKFMSSSLQYSDYSKVERFVIPPGLTEEQEKVFREYFKLSATTYDQLIASGVTSDQAGYVMPQALKGVLLISATPYQWKHMISQRVCCRNTEEVRYIFLQAWHLLNELAPELFADAVPTCKKEGRRCEEGKMSCGYKFTTNEEELKKLEGTDESKTDSV